MTNKLDQNKSSSTSKSKIILILVGVLALGAVGVMIRKNRRNVVTQQITSGSLKQAVFGVGSVKSERIFTAKIGTSAKLIKRHIRAGDQVKAGAALVELENIGTIRAPFTGVITSLFFNEGEMVFAQLPILELTDDHKLFIEISVDERSVVKVQPGQEAKISFDGYRGKPITGVVRNIYASASQFLVQVDFKPNELKILPYMSADVAISVGEIKDAVLIPMAAIAANGDVEVLIEGRREKKSAKLLGQDGNFGALVPGELKAGMEVIVKSEPK